MLGAHSIIPEPPPTLEDTVYSPLRFHALYFAKTLLYMCVYAPLTLQ